MSGSDPAILLDGVAKRYANGTQAVSGVDLAIGQGDFVSLLGPSGCGKSTLLRIIAGLVPPSSGTVTVSGGAGPEALGFVFQEPTLMPWASALKNVRLPLDLLGVARAEANARAAEALASVGLQGFETAYPRALSRRPGPLGHGGLLGMMVRWSGDRPAGFQPTLERFFALAEERCLNLDLHVDESGKSGAQALREIARTAIWYAPFLRKLRITYPNGLVHSIVTAATPIDDQQSMICQ